MSVETAAKLAPSSTSRSAVRCRSRASSWSIPSFNRQTAWPSWHNYVAQGTNEATSRWNCTEVYRRDPVGWRIVQTHWSFTQPPGTQGW